jgi:hypothetical protein
VDKVCIFKKCVNIDILSNHQMASDLQFDELQMLREYFDKNETEKFLRKISGLVNLEYDLVVNTGGIVEMAVTEGNLSAVKYLTTKVEGSWDPKSQFATQSLIQSISDDKCDICKYLVEIGCQITVDIIYQEHVIDPTGQAQDICLRIKNNVDPHTMIKALMVNGYDIKSLGVELLVKYINYCTRLVNDMDPERCLSQGLLHLSSPATVRRTATDDDKKLCNDLIDIFITQPEFPRSKITEMLTNANMQSTLDHLNKLGEVVPVETTIIAHPAPVASSSNEAAIAPILPPASISSINPEQSQQLATKKVCR